MSRWRIAHGLGLLLTAMVFLVELWRLVGLWSAALVLHLGLWAVAWGMGRAEATQPPRPVEQLVQPARPPGA